MTTISSSITPDPTPLKWPEAALYRCNFCSVHEFHRGEYKVQGNDRTLLELSKLPRNSWINIVDDLAIQELPGSLRMAYPAGFDPMDDLADKVIDMDLGQRYWMQVRADNVVRNPKKFEKWAKAGLDTVLIGLGVLRAKRPELGIQGDSGGRQRKEHRHPA